MAAISPEETGFQADDGLELGPTLRRRQLGRKLRGYREQAGRKVAEAAKYAGLRDATVSRIENGRHAIRPGNVRLLCQFYGVGAPTVDTLMRQAEESNDRGWWTAFSDTLEDWFETYVDLESDARELLTYSPTLVDGLLQTPEYALAVMQGGWPEITKSDLHRSVELRQARQEKLHQRGSTKQLHVVFDEAVLRRVVGGPEVMREQLESLIESAAKPNITIQVIPFSAGAHAGMKGAFSVLRFPEGFEDMNSVYLENQRGSVWQERPNDVDHYSNVFEKVSEQALSTSETTELMTSLVKHL
ncbi:helix-turn-helix transcriptional regulator [Saccharopolyspora sp. WRP15-2]|uniref:Helix-turn-helix transcriptional regulator n=1 Tax=Saccharopolyspora oryzae TaxID=2997343 RepID=A0ABT4UTF7_9PSEU|nr:helix-turn-helix transcriptional regulator [Saccharopolyspora oryzae]MDA3624983.1 helix-turn-helix transcriptional regulator [Saccharopolyspora oryzae]